MATRVESSQVNASGAFTHMQGYRYIFSKSLLRTTARSQVRRSIVSNTFSQRGTWLAPEPATDDESLLRTLTTHKIVPSEAYHIIISLNWRSTSMRVHMRSANIE